MSAVDEQAVLIEKADAQREIDDVSLALSVIDKYGADADKPSVKLALAYLNGAHERDRLRVEVEQWKAATMLIRDEAGRTQEGSNAYQQRWLDALVQRDSAFARATAAEALAENRFKWAHQAHQEVREAIAEFVDEKANRRGQFDAPYRDEYVASIATAIRSTTTTTGE